MGAGAGYADRRARAARDGELMSMAILRRYQETGIAGITSLRTNRYRNGLLESFNGRLRDERLNETMLRSMPDALDVLREWTGDYNGSRPHTSLAGFTANEFASGSTPRSGSN